MQSVQKKEIDRALNKTRLGCLGYSTVKKLYIFSYITYYNPPPLCHFKRTGASRENCWERTKMEEDIGYVRRGKRASKSTGWNHETTSWKGPRLSLKNIKRVETQKNRKRKSISKPSQTLICDMLVRPSAKTTHIFFQLLRNKPHTTESEDHRRSLTLDINRTTHKPPIITLPENANVFYVYFIFSVILIWSFSLYF